MDSESIAKDETRANAFKLFPPGGVVACLYTGDELPQATTTNGTTIFMEEVELWPDPVDGVELLNDLAATFKRHVALPDFAEALLALWVGFTWGINAAFTAPILAVTSPQKRCGKTTLSALLTQFVHKPLSASNITSAALFRSIEKWGPTLLVDEADTFLKDKEELRGVINAGHTRSTPTSSELLAMTMSRRNLTYGARRPLR